MRESTATSVSRAAGQAAVGPYIGFGLGGLISTLVVGAMILVSLAGTQVNPAAFAAPEAVKGVTRLVGGLFPPDLSGEFVLNTLGLMWQTLQISVASTVLALLLAMPLGLLGLRLRGEEYQRPAIGTGRWLGRWSAYYVARGVMNLCRAVPELVWALVFVATLGLGPYAGVMALAVHSAGVLGKLYAEILESVDQRIVEAVRATGAAEGQVTLWARVPLALPILLSYTLFRWECNMRAATVIGFVGAGGIGTAITISYKLFQYNQLSTLIIAILVLITVVDLTGQAIRTRVLDRGEIDCQGIADRVRGLGRRTGFLGRADH